MACGHYPENRILARYEFVLRPHHLHSHNELSGNYRGRAGWKYRRIRDEYIKTFSLWGLPKQTTYRRIWVTRFLGPRNKYFDEANLVGGLKCMLDALIECGLLFDDARDYIKVYYSQEKCLQKCECARIIIEDVKHAEYL